jgi:hypothetical protein
MNESITKLAEVGATFTISALWRCDCGREHDFGPYAAAHWSETLGHKCKCGTERSFKRGTVTKLKVWRDCKEK